MVKERTINLKQRFWWQFVTSIVLLLLILVLRLFFVFNPWGFVTGVLIGFVFWPLFWHKIRFGEPD